MDLSPRKEKIFRAIIESFISTARPVGSKTLIIHYRMNVSPATVRNDMLFLEKCGYICQPHTSAGRIPTQTGYRLYVDEMIDLEKEKIRDETISYLTEIKKAHLLEKQRERIYDAVSLISRAVHNLSFATVPGQEKTFYLGLAQTLKQPEFIEQPLQASQVIEILEESNHFTKTLESLDIDDQIRIFIGKENILPEIASCSLIVTRYRFKDEQGYIGILGPTRMNYALNTLVLEEIKKMLS